jgi:UDP-N-acetyl-D-glucosamine dehydrogenase
MLCHMSAQRTRVVVMGLGYVGLPLAVRAARVGHDVVGYDPDLRRVKQLNAGESYIEDVSHDDVTAITTAGLFRASSDAADLADFDTAVIAVPTPLHEGVPDLAYIEAAAKVLARHLQRGATVILESTTYPGTTADLVGPILENGSGLASGVDFFLGYSPERIDPGNPHHGLVNTPKLVSGIDDGSLAAVKAFYDSIVERTVVVSRTQEAELAKLLENTFRHVNVALVNEMAMFATDLGIDVWDAIAAASTKPFGFMPFQPGPGVGGHCLPIDPSYLSWRVRRTLGRPFRFVELANDINDHMPDYVVGRVTTALNRAEKAVNGSRILLLGLAYKRNTGDAREAPAIVIADRLLSLGASVSAADPYVAQQQIDPRVSRVLPTEAEIDAVDIVVLLTDHNSFDLELVRSHAQLVLDTRHCIPAGPNVEHL